MSLYWYFVVQSFLSQFVLHSLTVLHSFPFLASMIFLSDEEQLGYGEAFGDETLDISHWKQFMRMNKKTMLINLIMNF